jgi:hypothetical protein
LTVYWLTTDALKIISAKTGCSGSSQKNWWKVTFKPGWFEHLGQAKGDSVTNASDNTDNAKSHKTLKSECGELPIEIPPDHHGSFKAMLNKPT